MSISVIHLQNHENLADAHKVRAEVFQKEQGIPAADDFDGLDESAEQFVAYDENNLSVGTARYRKIADSVGKVERVAVLPSQRGKKTGFAIMDSIKVTAIENGIKRLELDSQLSAAGFNESLGYKKVGEPFDEVGIPHIKMAIDLATV